MFAKQDLSDKPFPLPERSDMTDAEMPDVHGWAHRSWLGSEMEKGQTRRIQAVPLAI